MKTAARHFAFALAFAASASVGFTLHDAIRPAPRLEPSPALETAQRLSAIEAQLAECTKPTRRPRPAATPSAEPTAASGELVARIEALHDRLDELSSAPAHPTTPVDYAVRDREKLEDPRNADALREAQDVVEYAIEDGEWTREDARQLRDLLPLLTWQQQDEVLAALLPALNDGLSVDFSPPF